VADTERIIERRGHRALRWWSVVIVAVAVALAPSVSAGAGLRGGSVTSASGDLSVLDPASPAASPSELSIAAQILGSLFLPSTTSPNTPVPDLATGYHFNHTGTSLVITLRRGVHFSDGTPLNPTAVIWNLKRVATSGAFDAPLLGAMTTVVATGTDAVTVNFSQPDFSFIDACITTAICDLASPTAFARLGSAVFSVTPVGAGPFKVQQNASGVVVLVRNPTYWDAALVNIDRWTLVNLGGDATAIYQSLIQGSIETAEFDGIATAPSLLFQAASNQNIVRRPTANTNYAFLPLNASRPPFSDQGAREALDYCTDRTALARSVSSGFAAPAYVLAGSASEYLPKPGGVRGAETLMPYRFDVAQGTSLVDQLGGLNFQLSVASGQTEVIANALAAQWQACGIHAEVVPLSPGQLDAAVTSGGYDAAFVEVPGSADPAASMTLESPASPLSVPGLSDPKLNALAQAAAATSTPSRLASLWHQIWFEENTDAIDIPIISSGTSVVVSHCVRDFSFEGGLVLAHAYLTCAA
jgi:peptide/nickel transport system substrate-binding protein